MADANETGRSIPNRYYGKYRGMVVSNVDPERRGRLLVQVDSDVPGLHVSSWAMPCLPFAGFQMGTYIVPPPSAGVWVEFEQGDPDYPIWTGFWWGSTLEVPATAQATTPGAPVVVLETVAKNALVVSDVPVPPMKAGGILLRSGPSYVAVDPTGVTIFGPKVTINGVTDINNSALTVTL